MDVLATAVGARGEAAGTELGFDRDSCPWPAPVFHFLRSEEEVWSGEDSFQVSMEHLEGAEVVGDAEAGAPACKEKMGGRDVVLWEL